MANIFNYPYVTSLKYLYVSETHLMYVYISLVCVKIVSIKNQTCIINPFKD